MTNVTINSSMFMQPRDMPESAWIGHIPFAAWITEELKPSVLVELGTHNGASYLSFCQAVKKNALETRCFAVDTWEGDKHAGRYGEEVIEALRDIHDSEYSDFSTLLRTTFDEAVSQFDAGSVDLLHIDGLHTYDAVKHDFETWADRLSRRGVVLFHDTMVRKQDFGVWKFWEEITQKYPSFEFNHSSGLGVLLVGDSVPASITNLAKLTEADAQATVRELFEYLAMGLGEPGEEQGAARPVDSGAATSFVTRQLSRAQSKLEEAYKQLGRADAYARTQAGHVDSLVAGIEERDHRIHALEHKVKQVELQLADADTQLVRADAYARTHVGQVEHLGVQIVERDKRIEALHHELETLKTQLSDANTQLVVADANARVQLEHGAQMDREVTQRDHRIHALEHRVAELEAHVAEATAQLVTADSNARTHVAQAAQLHVEITQRDHTIHALEHRVEELAGELASANRQLIAADAHAHVHVEQSARVHQEIVQRDHVIYALQQALVGLVGQSREISAQLAAAAALSRSHSPGVDAGRTESGKEGTPAAVSDASLADLLSDAGEGSTGWQGLVEIARRELAAVRECADEVLRLSESSEDNHSRLVETVHARLENLSLETVSQRDAVADVARQVAELHLEMQAAAARSRGFLARMLGVGGGR